ncbi:MAG: TonB-dependent siderophore receptor [Sphingobium sp.]
MVIVSVESGFRALLASTALVSMVVGIGSAPAQAQSTTQAGTQQFDIPAQSLASALMRFSRETRLELFYSAELAQGKTTQGVKGNFAPAEALSRLLAGTGLTFKYTNATTITLEPAPQSADGAIQLGPVRVEGEGGSGTAFGTSQPETAWGPVRGYVATRSATGSKTDAPLTEIPQTINVITADQIKAQGAQSVSEALRYTAGVRAEGYGAASPFDVYTQVHGFRSDLYLDGLRLPTGSVEGTASAVIEPWALERLEVLKGPASGIYGQAGPGGIINMVTKRPTETPVREIQVQGGSFDRIQGAFDFGGPIGEGGQFLYRVTGLARSSETQWDYGENKRAFIAPALMWRPDNDTSLTVLGMYQRDRGVWNFFNYMPEIGSVYDYNGRKIPTNVYLGEPDFDKLKREQWSVGYELQHRFNDRLSFKQNLRFNRTDYYTRAVITGRSYLTGDGQIDRGGIHQESPDKTFAIDNQIKIDFPTGPLNHEALVGLDYRHENSSYLYTKGSAPSLNVFNPQYNAGPITVDDITLSNYKSLLDQIGIYAQDRIKFGHWVVTLGGRYDRAKTTVDNAGTTYSSASRTHQNDGVFTGRAGLTYLFESGVSPYVSYATSFQPQTGSDTITGTAFKPTRGKQFEAGIKYQPIGMKALITIAAFDLTQTNRVTTDTLYQQRQLGEVNIRGIEFEAKAEVLTNFTVLASYAYLDHKITKSSNPAEIGRKLFSTPNHQASLWGDYSFVTGPLSGLALSAGVRYAGTNTDLYNTLEVPAVTLFDARVKLDLENISPTLAGVSLAVNASNIFDKKYVSQCDGDTMCTYGARRTILATLNYKW